METLCPNSNKSVLLLDNFICRKHPKGLTTLQSVGTRSEFVFGGYTCVLRLYDAGILKHVEGGTRQHYTQ